MTMPEDPPLRSPEQAPDLASQWRTGGGSGSVSWNVIKLLLLFFSSGKWIYSVGIRSDGAKWAPWGTRARQGVACPGASWAAGGPLKWILAPVFFIYSIKNLQKVSSNSKNFYFCTKTTPWLFCWKQRQSGLASFKSCKLESKTRAKVFGKVDTTEMYQLPQA